MSASSTWETIKVLHFHSHWVFDIAMIVFATIVFITILKLTYNFLMPRFKKTNKIWDDTFLYAFYNPILFLAILLSVTSCLQIIDNAWVAINISGILRSVQHVGIILFFLWFSFRFIRKVADRLIHPEYRSPPMNQATVELITKIAFTALSLFAAVMVLQTFGVKIGGVLAISGAGALIVTWAAKDALANFFGGLMIYFDRPFDIGDWIRLPDQTIEGTVEKVGWRLTRIRTFDKRPLYVPNSIFSTVSVENPSRMTNRRIQTTFGVRYCDAPKIDAITNDIEQMLKEHPEIDQRQTTIVKLVEFGESSLNILVYTFTKTTLWVKFQAIQQDVFLKIIEIVYNKHKASMAFPTRTLDVPPHSIFNICNQKELL